MNTTVYLIRHGEIDNPQNVLYGRTIDVKLSETGKSQIKNLAQRMKEDGEIPQKIYTSPLSRAVDSSKILSAVLEVEYIIENNLNDVDIPALAGKPMSERRIIHESGIDEYSGKYVNLGNEPRDHAVSRMLNVFGKIVIESSGKRVALVSHGDPIQFLLYALRNPEKEVPSMNILVDQNYPKKGSAVKLVVDENLKIQKESLI